MTVVVLGSINIDIVSRVDALPKPGETTPGGPLSMFLGGKGANQAIAAARAGAQSKMLGCLGAETFGLHVVDLMTRDGVDMSAVARVDGPSGAALIGVDAAGENSIIVSAGANGRAAEASFPDPPEGAIVAAQLELPADVVLDYFHRARAAGARTMLNAAPALPAPDALLSATDVLIVNETELETYAGPGEPAEAAARLRRGAAQTVIVTLGAEGLLALHEDEMLRLPAPRVDVVDTTGAGDCFCGVLAASLSQNRPMDEALRRAIAAASLSVTKPGASDSMPTSSEILAALRS